MSVIPIFDKQGLSIDTLDQPGNLDIYLSDEESDAVARQVIMDYEDDKQSRADWDETAKEWRELAMQVAKDKSFPWPGASNVKFPLLTIAALQFASRAYPALVRPPTLVRMRVNGADPDNQKRKRARRVAEHLSWQLTDQDEKWEEHHDKLLAVLPISGIAYKKTYFCRQSGHNKSELCLPHEVIVNYWATDLDDATITHVYRLTSRQITERMRAGIYTEKELEPPQQPDETAAGEREKRTATVSHDQHTMLEQHRWLDLDNDGLEEPYVVTVDYSSQKVVRIQNRFQAVISDGTRIIRIEPKQYFTKYGFLPAPDGSFYELGFGCLLGPINESVNSLINQIIDSGTMQVGSRGFIGRGARFQGGQIRFKHPYEWIRVNTSGATLKDSIVPLPVNPPSPVLFQLLGLLVQYGQQVSSVTEMMQGKNPGQNTPAYNMRELLNQGMQVFTGIFKRVYRNMRDEYRKLYLLNREYLNPEEYFTFGDEGQQNVFQQDYQSDPKDLSPNADPNQALRETRVQMASMVLERAQMVPGYNTAEVEREWLEAIEHPNADRIFPLDPNTGQPMIPPPANPEIEVKVAEEQRRQLEGMQRGKVSEIEAMTKAMVGEAQVLELQTRAELNLAKAKEAGDSTAIKLFEAQLKQISEKRQALEALIKDSTERKKIEQQSTAPAGGD
jgi:chaperonin GroES